MAKYTRIQVVQEMYKTGIVPVFYHNDLEVCKSILKACYDAGVRVFEFTNRGDYAHEVFADLNKYALQNLPGMILGIGSVIDAGTASLYLQLGANFIVAPIVNADTAKVCNRRKVAWMPGCGSVTEISYAEELGAEVVKIFPATQVGGPEFIKAVKGPLPWSSIMPTGGVEPTEESLTAWFTAGAHCVGLGSQVFIKSADGGYDHAAITKKLQYAFSILKKVRGTV
jgi:2-dehydro-3-deoxyphosphogluconate aldolase/(4S)-4-hydroxy-2-oxoglutarate aldolase